METPLAPVLDYATLAAIITAVVKLITATYARFAKREMTSDSKRVLTNAICFGATLGYLYWTGNLVTLDWHNAAAVVGLFSIVNTVAHNLYDKTVGVADRLAGKAATPDVPASLPDSANLAPDWPKYWGNPGGVQLNPAPGQIQPLVISSASQVSTTPPQSVYSTDGGQSWSQTPPAPPDHEPMTLTGDGVEDLPLRTDLRPPGESLEGDLDRPAV